MDNLYSSSWEFEDNIWTIPSDDKEGYIEVKDSNPGKVLALNGEDVVLDDKTKKLTNSQIWIKGPENSEGCFSLKNKETGKFLTLFIHKVKGERTTLISVKGKASLVYWQIAKLTLKDAGGGPKVPGGLISLRVMLW